MSVRYAVEYIKPSNRTRTGWSREVSHVDTRAEAVRVARELAEKYPQYAEHVTIVTRETLDIRPLVGPLADAIRDAIKL